MKHNDRHSEFRLCDVRCGTHKSSQEQLNSRVAHRSSHQYVSSQCLFLSDRETNLTEEIPSGVAHSPQITHQFCYRTPTVIANLATPSRWTLPTATLIQDQFSISYVFKFRFIIYLHRYGKFSGVFSFLQDLTNIFMQFL
jgi:hypothetical protein